MNSNGGLQPVASMALAYSDTLLFQQLLSQSHDPFPQTFSSANFLSFGPFMSVSFFSCSFFYFLPGFSLNLPLLFLFHVCYTVIFIPPALAVFVTLASQTLGFWARNQLELVVRHISCHIVTGIQFSPMNNTLYVMPHSHSQGLNK